MNKNYKYGRFGQNNVHFDCLWTPRRSANRYITRMLLRSFIYLIEMCFYICLLLFPTDGISTWK